MRLPVNCASATFRLAMRDRRQQFLGVVLFIALRDPEFDGIVDCLLARPLLVKGSTARLQVRAGIDRVFGFHVSFCRF